ncbi:sensor histidine kinase [Legionella waltersii]|uniref:histidine kinase n=1 Tax=Legionella waltersii TaxID=66969 RepID=A0A0W1A2U1_9GAMM|nr:HAMP domain-containing sensor histidine kinase [Legionella waltersii]KTD75622.1 sensor protein PilS [Legionella waltersii]SNV03093.1 two-component system sensor kinase PilS [Legionella waltersii]
MPLRQYKSPEARQWRILLVYNLYRLLSLFLFLGMYYFSFISKPHSPLFYSIVLTYFQLSLFFFYCLQKRLLSFENQVFLSGTIDVIFVSIMLSIIGNLQSGYGILLNVTIAALSILAPGRLAIYFASLASFLLLTGNGVQFIANNQKDLGIFYYSGIYGAGFFATALTAWYLSNWVRASETLAQQRSYQLAGMQRINEYIVERLHSGIVFVDDCKNIKLINTASKQLFNKGKNSTIEHLEQLSPLLSEKFDEFLVKKENNKSLEQTFLEDPYLRIHFFSTAIINNPEFLIILEDMTYIAQHAQQLKLAALGRFSASIAHELRNPLGAISHAVQLLGEDEELSKENKRLKELIINNCERMNNVIKNVLQLSRREQSQPQLTDLREFLQHFKQTFAHHSQCHIVVRIPKNKTYSIVFDKSQLEQILVILCENAIQHGQNVEGKVDIVIGVKSISNKIILTVSDSGPGIPKEHRDSIFEPFFTTLRTGTGMGLFIARDLCEINRASLSLVKSHKGCCFAISLNSSDELLL